MTRDRIGVGVVGVGMMGRRHGENAAQWIPGARLAAVFDADRALAARVGRDLDADTCGSLEELLGRDDILVVVIASPREFHAEQAVAALSRGRDVLLEKPMGLSLAARDAHGHAPNAALNAVRFAGGALADIETYWGARYAYDVRTEIVCANGAVLIGHQQRSRLAVYTPAGATHDLFPGFLERFAEAYRAELADFVDGALERRLPAVTGRDGRAAVAAALAGVASFESGRPADVAA